MLELVLTLLGLFGLGCFELDRVIWLVAGALALFDDVGARLFGSEC